MTSCQRSISGLGRALLLAAALLTWQQQAFGGCDEFRGSKIRWIIPWSVGGGYDTYSRLIGPAYAARLDAEVRFENVPGAGGRIGAEKIKSATPDGHTVGILSGVGLMALSLSGDEGVPDLQEDFAMLGRIQSYGHVWAAGQRSGVQSVEQLWQPGRPVPVFGVTGPAAGSFVVSAIASDLLGFVPDVVSGYRGSRQTKLAAIRGDVDVVSHNYSSLRTTIATGDLVPLLRIGLGSEGSDEHLREVPPLEGDDGIALARARELGRDLDKVRADAAALVSLLKLGRLVAAPRAIEAGLAACMATALMDALQDPAVVAALAAAGRPLDPAQPDIVYSDLATVAARSQRLQPIIAAALMRLRR